VTGYDRVPPVRACCRCVAGVSPHKATDVVLCGRTANGRQALRTEMDRLILTMRSDRQPGATAGNGLGLLKPFTGRTEARPGTVPVPARPPTASAAANPRRPGPRRRFGSSAAEARGGRGSVSSRNACSSPARARARIRSVSTAPPYELVGSLASLTTTPSASERERPFRSRRLRCLNRYGGETATCGPPHSKKETRRDDGSQGRRP
jgi:hypothetical protein